MKHTAFADRLAGVRARIDAACRAAGRDPAEVTLLPVSKGFDADAIRAAAALGLRRFGENRVQELAAKAAALVDLEIDWVVIGHLQTNKARDVARLAREVQSLDRLELAVALQRHLRDAGRDMDVLVQVKTATEESKHGLPPAALADFLEQLRDFPRLRVRGLMTIATHSDDPAVARGCFRHLREWRDAMQARGHALPRLSMGMSDDFALAIAEGSTEVRIGTALFGARGGGAARRNIGTSGYS
jgi:pyridoxal phosphate enzyme (YggS family)